jgi:hypothetical protein
MAHFYPQTVSSATIRGKRLLKIVPVAGVEPHAGGVPPLPEVSADLFGGIVLLALYLGGAVARLRSASSSAVATGEGIDDD